MVNVLSPGDAVLMVETGQFATQWKNLAQKLQLKPEFIAGDWRHGVHAPDIEARLSEDTGHHIKAVCVVHNETSTGVTSDIAAVRAAIDAAHHPALLMVDTISGIGSIKYQHDAWGVDVTIGASQKGLMMPPGLGFNALATRPSKPANTQPCPTLTGAGMRSSKPTKKGYGPPRQRPTCSMG